MRLVLLVIALALAAVAAMYIRTSRIETLLDLQHVITLGLLDYKADTSRVLDAMSRKLDISERFQVFDASQLFEDVPFSQEGYVSPQGSPQGGPVIYDMSEEPLVKEQDSDRIVEIKGVPSEFDVYKMM